MDNLSGMTKICLRSDTLTREESYGLLSRIIVPRPIAFVSTLSKSGILNLAPFAFYNAACNDPPMLSLAIASFRDGSKKDTAQNIIETGEFVVNNVDESLAEKANLASTELPQECNEFEYVGLTPQPASRVRPPMLAEAAISMECRAAHILPLGNPAAPQFLIVGEVLAFHLRESLLEGGRIQLDRLRPIGRWGGYLFAGPGQVFEMIQPSSPRRG